MTGSIAVGNSSLLFEVESGWGKLPEGMTYGYTHGVCVDSNDNVYIFNTSKDSIIKFDKEGNYITSWGSEFEGGAHGFYLHKDRDGKEYFYITDITSSRVVKTSINGEILLELSQPELPDVYDQKRRYIPTDVCVGPNGDIYISDGYGQYYIHQYNSKGDYIRSWGGHGSEPGKLLEPHGISINLRGPEPEVYVADRRNHRIQVFTLEGEHKRFVDQDLDLPCSFYFYGNDVYIPDLNSRVTVLDQHDCLVCHLGEDQQAYKQEGWPNLPKAYYRPDRFSSPHGVCVDSQGNVYVVEWISDGRVTKLKRV
ncbi:hypothetical protein [Bacillus sp. SA1-12]|uniref:hypothetical protein n=1 Tax=Bacillus sp. SA1-12 TaxID=1455638 RepID=UPI000698EA7E|nr:hypothetical protein [Bacillus sp. SA1-12]